MSKRLPKSSLFSLILGVLCCALWFSLPRPALAAPQTTLTETSKELICDCPDCGHQSIDQCPAGCASAKKYRATIAGLIEQGKSKEQIINYFADNYGEHMVGNPRPRGIGIIAPVVPWAGALLGLAVVMVLLRSGQSARRKRGFGVTVVAGSQAAMTAEPDDPRLSAALRNYDY